MKLDFDVAVVGGGPVGLAFAGWLALFWGGRANRIAVFDAKPLDKALKDQRTLALGEATRLRLAELAFPTQAVPIHRIHVSDQGGFGQVRMAAQEMGLDALGWTVQYGPLVECLAQVVQELGVQVFRPAQVQPSPQPPGAPACSIELADGQQFQVGLRIDAEGGLYGQTDPRDQVFDYGQWALVGSVTAQVDPALLKPNQTLAFERFTPAGPAALLPTATDQQTYSMVWCDSEAQISARMEQSEREFCDSFGRVFGKRVRIQRVGQRYKFPLGMNLQNKLVNGRVVAIGNAAQIVHPVAGQGLNLGLRDALALAKCLAPEKDLAGSDLTEVLAQFEKFRAFDRKGIVRVTDWLVRGFSSGNPVLRCARQAVLNGVEVLPLARQQFAQGMLYGLG